MTPWSKNELGKLSQFLGKAQANGVSDIHINPADRHYSIRVRHHGRITVTQELSQEAGRSLVQRIKAQAQLNLAESRCAQDGRIAAHPPEHREVRVACHPTLYGENIVIRLFAPQSLRRIAQLGVGPETQRRLLSGIETEEGLILVCGPTGAGKTSTLHALLSEIGSEHSNVMTLEDPVEIVMAGALQTDLSQLPKMDFANGLRSLLRQDPDIILVGEIRDSETALLAVEAAMTGHLVLASLHAADKAGALARLEMLGLAPERVIPQLRNLICQRLVSVKARNLRLPIMQIWTPGGSSQSSKPSAATPANVWHFEDCLSESIAHGLMAASDRPAWLPFSKDLLQKSHNDE
jgi:type II secretory ATPase GspE/PulE/Tfp pilus assembly ATPase PilB-like protein